MISKFARCALALVGAVAFCVGCGVLEWASGIHQSKMENTELKPYLDAASRSSRLELGFTAMPPSGPVRVEIGARGILRSKTHYDAMLHINQGNVSRTVAFLIRDGLPVWSGEKEAHYSPRKFKTVDGTVREHLVISYSTVQGSGTPKGGYVDYWGPDSRLQGQANQGQLSVAAAKRVWDGWPK